MNHSVDPPDTEIMNLMSCALNSSRYAQAIVRADSSIVYANSAFQRLVGMPVGEVAGSKFDHLLEDSQHLSLSAIIRENLLEQMHVIRGKSSNYLEMYVTKLSVDSNNSYFLVDCKQATSTPYENELKAKEEFLTAVVDILPAMFFMKDANEVRFTMVNREFERVAGAGRNDIIGKSDYDFFPADQADFFTAQDRKTLKSDEVSITPCETIQSVEGEKKLLTQKLALRDSSGVATHLIGIATDITDLIAAQNQLISQRRLLDQMSQLGRIGGWRLIMGSNEIVCTDETLKIHGIAEHVDVTIENILQCYHQDDRKTISGAVHRAIQDGCAFDHELRIVNTSGRTVWVKVKGEPDLNESGEAVCIVGVIQDISHLKEVEELKNNFISTVSHELRTPLTSINGSIKLINNMGASQEAKASRQEMLNVIDRNSSRLIAIVNDLLDTEKLAANKLEYQFQSVSVNETIEDIVSENRQVGLDREIKIRFTPLVEDRQIRIDKVRIAQVISNLLSNAIKHSPPASFVDVKIACVKDRVSVTVKDKGKGIPESLHEHIFSRFAQIESPTQRDVYGTGLGLSIAKTMSEQMKGALIVKSKEGQGAEFEFSIKALPIT